MHRRQSRTQHIAYAACVLFALFAGLACVDPTTEGPIAPDEVSPRQRAMVDSIGATLAPLMTDRSPEAALLVEMAELYAPLDAEQRAFLDAIRALEGGDPALPVAARETLVEIPAERLTTPSGEKEIPLRLISREAARAWAALDAAMRADLGRGLVIGSGYRSPANQLFLFVRYMPFYDYAPDRTRPHVSLPGASDHNRPDRQGVDFVSEQGVDLAYSDAAAFRALPEYRWLLEHAARFGFQGEGPDGLSPWHWHYAGRD